MYKIAHVTMFFGNQLGVINKLDSLAKSCIDNNINIDYIWITKDNKDTSNIKNLNVLKIKGNQNVFMLRKKQVDILNKLSIKYNKIIIRYPLFDPIILLFLKDKKKYIFEHHTKEIEELYLKRDKRYLFEKYLGSMWLRKFGGIIGVTEEIRKYEIQRSGFEGFSTFCPNSIAIEKNKKVEGIVWDNELLNIVIVANFRPWHGLKYILNEIAIDKEYKGMYKLHIIGKINNISDENLIKQLDDVIYYGEKTKSEIEKIYQNIDIGLGVFNAKIKGLNETTSLKVREYLSNGIPVIIGDIDPAFPKDYKYVKQVKSFSIKNVFDYALEVKGTPKNIVLDSSRKYIESGIILKKLYQQISEYEKSV
jgi:hypothetical protein